MSLSITKNNQKEIYFITATNTDVGKTYSSEYFLKKFSKEGKRVGYYKPLETGVIDNKPIDGLKLLTLTKKLNPEFKNIKLKDIVPYQFKLPAAPYVANLQENNINISIDIIKEKAKYLLNFCDVLIIEGAGGLMVPIKLDYL